MTERDEQVIVDLVSNLIEVASKHDLGLIQSTLGLTPEQTGAFDFHALKVEDRMRLAEEIIREYTDDKLSADVKGIILAHVRQVYELKPDWEV